MNEIMDPVTPDLAPITPELMDAHAAMAVSRGVAYLDAHYPDWLDRVEGDGGAGLIGTLTDFRPKGVEGEWTVDISADPAIRMLVEFATVLGMEGPPTVILDLPHYGDLPTYETIGLGEATSPFFVDDAAPRRPGWCIVKAGQALDRAWQAVIAHRRQLHQPADVAA